MEEHFKNKLKNHKVDWDKESLLGNLKEELSPNKSRFDWKWLLLLPLLLLVTCWGWNNLQRPTANATLTQIENNSVLNEKENNVVENTPISQDEINIENDQLSANTIKQPNENASTSTSELNQSEPEIELVINSARSKTKTKSNLPPPPSSFNDLSKTKSPIAREQPIKDPIIITIPKTTEKPKDFLDIPAAKKSTNNVALNIEETRKDILPLSAIPFLGWKDLNLIIKREDLPDLSTVEKFQEIDKVSLKNPFYISASGELGLVYRSRKFNVNDIDNREDFINRLEDNEDTEKSLLAITTNLFIGYQHTSGWSLQSGLEYSEINEVLNYFNKSATDTIRVLKEEPLYFIVDNMDTLFVRDSTNVFVSEERTVKHFNKHRFYSIPLQVGYQFNLKKAKLITRLGLSYTFAHNYTGRMNYIFEEGGNEIISNNLDFDFELKNRIGLQVGLALEYPFLKRSQFFATATYRRSPRLTMGVIEQSYHSLSLGAGFRFSLGSNLTKLKVTPHYIH